MTAPLILLLTCAALYAHTIFFGLSGFDDVSLLVDNAGFLSRWQNLISVFGRDAFSGFADAGYFYRPLLTLSFFPDAALAGGRLWPYHATNLFLHGAAVLLAYRWFARLAPHGAALAGALFLAVSPVLTQAVAWIPGRNDSLLTIFALAAMLSLEKNCALYGLFFFSALLTKESALALIPVSAAWLVIGAPRFSRTRWLKLIGVWVAASGAYFSLRGAALGADGFPTLSALASEWKPAAVGTLGLMGKIIWPAHLSAFPTLDNMTLWPGALLMTLLAGLFIFSKPPSRQRIVFCLLWFTAFLLPSFQSRASLHQVFFLEHRLYLPLVGLLCGFIQIRHFEKILVVLALVFAPFAWLHAWNFKDPEAFWSAARRSAGPQAQAIVQNHWARTLIDEQKWNEAEQTVRTLVAADPEDGSALETLGLIYFKQGRYEDAKPYWQKARLLMPSKMALAYGLGVIALKENNFTPARENFETVLRVNPGYDQALFSLGMVHYKEGRTDEAAAYWQKTLQSNPRHTDALVSLAKLEADRGRAAKAQSYLDRAHRQNVLLEYRSAADLSRLSLN